MIRSMTGFGAAEHDEAGVRYRVEIRSLNNRYFKSSIKLPESLQFLETEIDKLLRAELTRGSITFSLKLRDEGPGAAFEINQAALARYLEQLDSAAIGDRNTIVDLATLATLPGVCQPPVSNVPAEDSLLQLIRRPAVEAIKHLVAMRVAEGQALLADLEAQCAVIRSALEEVRERSPSVVREYHEKLRVRVRELMNAGQLQLDADSLAREVAVFAERCDVNEEVARLASHLNQFVELCKSGEAAGRKLEFIAQEMLREANTIGSKANDSSIARRVVEIKAAVDRIKEQVQNVE